MNLESGDLPVCHVDHTFEDKECGGNRVRCFVIHTLRLSSILEGGDFFSV
jgi:hypothetical protein